MNLCNGKETRSKEELENNSSKIEKSKDEYFVVLEEEQDEKRKYVSIWEEQDEKRYTRVHGASGDPGMIERWYSEYVSGKLPEF